MFPRLFNVMILKLLLKWILVWIRYTIRFASALDIHHHHPVWYDSKFPWHNFQHWQTELAPSLICNSLVANSISPQESRSLMQLLKIKSLEVFFVIAEYLSAHISRHFENPWLERRGHFLHHHHTGFHVPQVVQLLLWGHICHNDLCSLGTLCCYSS